MSTPLLQVEHLRVTYRVARRKVVAVQDASFVARRGRCLGIAGESGSGKSSLARAILALEDQVSGKVLFDGQDVLRQTPPPRLQARPL